MRLEVACILFLLSNFKEKVSKVYFEGLKKMYWQNMPLNLAIFVVSDKFVKMFPTNYRQFYATVSFQISLERSRGDARRPK